MSKLKFFLILPFLLLLQACIVVEDAGIYWDKAILDIALEGSWKKTNKDHKKKGCYTFAVDGKSYRSVKGTKIEKGLYRTLVVGSHKFFIIKYISDGKEIEKEFYVLVKYKVLNDSLTLYRSDLKGKEDILRSYLNKNISLGDKSKGIAIKKLDEDAISTLEKLAGHTEFWKKAETYKRVKECNASHAS